MGNSSLLVFTLLSVFIIVGVIADTPSYVEVLQREHTRFIKDVQNPKPKPASQWNNKYNYAIVGIGLNLFALNKMYSIEAQKLVGNIQSYITEITLSKTPLAASWTNKLQHLSQLVHDKLLVHVHLRNIFDLSKYALALYMAADTGKLLYESWIYESVFEESGETLDRIRKNMQDCNEKTNQLQGLLDQLVNVISQGDENDAQYNYMTKSYRDRSKYSSINVTFAYYTWTSYIFSSRHAQNT
jgi:hypothetical protein